MHPALRQYPGNSWRHATTHPLFVEDVACSWLWSFKGCLPSLISFALRASTYRGCVTVVRIATTSPSLFAVPRGAVGWAIKPSMRFVYRTAGPYPTANTSIAKTHNRLWLINRQRASHHTRRPSSNATSFRLSTHTLAWRKTTCKNWEASCVNHSRALTSLVPRQAGLMTWVKKCAGHGW